MAQNTYQPTYNSNYMHTYVIRVNEYGTGIPPPTIIKIRNLFATAVLSPEPSNFLRYFFHLCNITWAHPLQLTAFYKTGTDPTKPHIALHTGINDCKLCIIASYIDLSTLEKRAQLQIAFQTPHIHQVDQLEIPTHLKRPIKALMWRMGKDTPFPPYTKDAQTNLVHWKLAISTIHTLAGFLEPDNRAQMLTELANIQHDLPYTSTNSRPPVKLPTQIF